MRIFKGLVAPVLLDVLLRTLLKPNIKTFWHQRGMPDFFNSLKCSTNSDA